MIRCTCQPGFLDALCGVHGVAAKDPAVRSRLRDERKSRRRLRRSPLRLRSEKQAYREGFLAGVRDERIRLLGFRCEWCDRTFTDAREARRALQLHHVGTQRSLGPRATPSDVGVDDPEKLILVCVSCHRALEDDEPRWSA